jgi:hypothetical protein
MAVHRVIRRKKTQVKTVKYGLDRVLSWYGLDAKLRTLIIVVVP